MALFDEFFRHLYTFTMICMASSSLGVVIYFQVKNKGGLNGLANLIAVNYITQAFLFGTIGFSLLFFQNEMYWMRALSCVPFGLAQYKFVKYVIKL